MAETEQSSLSIRLTFRFPDDFFPETIAPPLSNAVFYVRHLFPSISVTDFFFDFFLHEKTNFFRLFSSTRSLWHGELGQVFTRNNWPPAGAGCRISNHLHKPLHTYANEVDADTPLAALDRTPLLIKICLFFLFLFLRPQSNEGGTQR